jgi:segregation and condensation protein B
MSVQAEQLPQSEASVIVLTSPIESDEQAVEPVDTTQFKRVVEAALLTSSEPLSLAELKKLGDAALDNRQMEALLDELARDWQERGVELTRVASGWRFRAKPEMQRYLDRLNPQKPPRYSRAVLETLAIIAYHQPVTRAEIEEIRGVTLNRGTLDILLELGWVKMRGRRRVPGRPVTYGTSDDFLMHFGLDKVSDLPGLDELRAAGLIEGRIPPGFGVPAPSESLAMDEDPLDADDAGETFEPEADDSQG